MSERSNCKCFTEGPQPNWKREKLGETQQFGEVYLLTCSACSSQWLKYFYEHEAFTASQRSYVGYLGSVPAPNPNDAVALLGALDPRFIWGKKERRWVYYTGAIPNAI